MFFDKFKIRFFLLLLLNINCNCNFCQNTEKKSDKIKFATNDKKLILEGTIAYPKKTNGFFIILVSPPFAYDRHYLGLFDQLSDSLCKKGFTILKFDNRNYKYKNFGARMTMQMQAEDAFAAFQAIKSKKIFSSMRIGFLGHSEGASAISIIASEKKGIDFCILLSPIGINGNDYVFSQRINLINQKSFLFVSDSVKNKFIELNKDLIKLSKEEDDTLIILNKTHKIYEEFYKKNNPIFKGENNKINSLIEQGISINIGLINFIKYTPAKYYSKIKCPILIFYGSEDHLLDPIENMINIQKIMKIAGNKNYNIKIIYGLNHNFLKDLPFKLNSTSFKDANYISGLLISYISDWYNKDYYRYKLR